IGSTRNSPSSTSIGVTNSQPERVCRLSELPVRRGARSRWGGCVAAASSPVWVVVTGASLAQRGVRVGVEGLHDRREVGALEVLQLGVEVGDDLVHAGGGDRAVAVV